MPAARASTSPPVSSSRAPASRLACSASPLTGELVATLTSYSIDSCLLNVRRVFRFENSMATCGGNQTLKIYGNDKCTIPFTGVSEFVFTPGQCTGTFPNGGEGRE